MSVGFPLDETKNCSIHGKVNAGQTVEIQIGDSNYEYEVPEGKEWSVKVAVIIVEKSI